LIVHQTNKQLKGWYAYQFTYMVMFIIGITALLREEQSFWPSIMIGFSLIVLFTTMIIPMVRIIDQKIELYAAPFPKPSYILLINEIEKIELLMGHIQIKLHSGKVINYRPSPLETDLNRVIIFIKAVI